MWLSKIGMGISLIGGIIFYLMIQTGEYVILTCILGGIMMVFGWIFGWKAFDWGISPIGLLSLSSLAIFENKLISALLWGIRFFFLTALIIGIVVLACG